MKIIVRSESFRVTTLGSAWGVVYLSFGDDIHYPSAIWDDLVFAVIERWGQQLLELANPKRRSFALSFMDGPYKVMFQRTDTSWMAIPNLSAGTIICNRSYPIEIDELIKSYIVCGEMCLSAIDRLGKPQGELVAIERIAEMLTRLRPV